MGLRKRNKKLSRLTKSLLKQGEDDLADFKKIPDGIKTDDLVAFANSDLGGNIIAGVDEETRDGAQVGVVKGCVVDDATILQVFNKAAGCVPPISIDIFVENLDQKPILRVAVPPSTTKPHCTPKGIYCRRDGSRNRPLHPGELLNLFLETEAKAFAERFEAGANQISQDLSQLESTLEDSIENMASQLGWADIQLGDTETTLNSILAMLHLVTGETNDISSRVRTLFRQDQRDDPVRERERKRLLLTLVDQITKDEKLRGSIIAGDTCKIEYPKKIAVELTEDEREAVVQEVINLFRSKEELRKKYEITVNSPKKLNNNLLDQLASLLNTDARDTAMLRDELSGAFRIGLIRFEGEVVGVAAITKPLLARRRVTFKLANSKFRPADFPYELDCIFLQKQHRKKGQMGRLLQQLLDVTKNKGVFATASLKDELSLDVLSEHEFVQEGDEFTPIERPKKRLGLFLQGTQQVG